MTINPGETFGR